MSRALTLLRRLVDRAGGPASAAVRIGVDRANLSNVLSGARPVSERALRYWCRQLQADDQATEEILAAWQREHPDTEGAMEASESVAVLREQVDAQRVTITDLQQLVASQLDLIGHWRAVADEHRDRRDQAERRIQVLETELIGLRERVAKMQRRTPKPDQMT